QIVKLVKDKTGRALTIQGDIGLKFFPKIGAEVSQAQLSERNSDREFAGVNRVQVFVALLPLLSKQVVVDEVRLDGLRANLIKYKDGTTNFSDLAQTGKAHDKPETSPAPSEPGKPLKLDIAGVQVTNSHVTWKDETNGNDVALDLKQLETGHLADKTPTRIKLDLSIKGNQPRADLHAVLSGMLTFDLAGQVYSFKGLDAKVDGSALDFTGIIAALKGDVDTDGATQLVRVSGLTLTAQATHAKDVFDIKLSAPQLESSPKSLAVDNLSLSASGTVAGITLSQSDLKAPKVQINLASNQVSIDGLALTAKGEMGADNLDINFSAPRLEVSNEKASGGSATLVAKLSGAERNADVSLKLSAVEGSAKALKIAALTLDIDAKQKDNAIKGTLTTPVIGNLETRTFELPKIVARFNVSSPSIPRKSVEVPLAASVRADLTKQRVDADLTTHFDESNIKAKLGMLRFSGSAYTFDIAIDQLNVDKYLPPKQVSAGDKGAGKPTTQEPEKPIDLSPLKTLDLDGKLQIGQLQVDNVKATSVRVGLRAKGGKLDVDPLVANLYQGNMAGAISVDANTNHFVVKEKLTGIAIGPLLRDAANKDILDGKGNVTLDVTTTGNLVSVMKKQLNGSAQLALRDGAIKGIDLAGAVRNVKAKFGGKDAEGSGSANEKTDFSELTASFAIKNGIAHNEDLSLKSPFIRVNGTGDVNVGEDSVDYVVKTGVVATAAGQGGKDLAQLKGFTIPVRVHGPYAALKYKVEFSQMLSGASKEALKATAEEALKGIANGKLDKDSLKDLGKQLLGGGGAKSSTQSDQPAAGQQAAPAQTPQDQLKDRLKGLLNR
ncbi:MAG: AsmA family protein, partial [Betaproteobacteria bacterium]